MVRGLGLQGQLLHSIVQPLHPGESLGTCFGHAAIEGGVVAMRLPGGLERIEEQVVFA